MIYAFGEFRLDTEQFRLTRSGAAVHVEPLVFDLIRFFAENAGAVIDRDRLLAAVWDGRFVSEATISTAVKSARQALGDTGAAQRWIETIRGRGFRFCAPVAAERPTRLPAAPAPPAAPAEAEPRPGGMPAIAVLPFTRLGDPQAFPGLETAIPHEVILGLARLRSVFVIARGSSFRLGGAADALTVGHTLGVGYRLAGSLELFAGRLAISVELAETGTGGVLWGDRLEGPLDAVHELRAAITRGTVTALESRVQLHEALRARDRPPENLDAFAAFHLGLSEMHRYTREGNVAAGAHFRHALALEPGFARAHAGLSFVHFQNAFLRHVPDREAEITAAVRSAERGVELDPLDPFANLNLGRSHWLREDLDGAAPWLERATALSPNYAQGFYSRSLGDALSGNSTTALAGIDQAVALSPLDPLLYAMRATRALAAIARGDVEEGARWAEVAARTPRAHVIIAMIAAAGHALAGDRRAAARWTRAIRRDRPDASSTLFFEALPAADPALRGRLLAGLSACGF